MSFERTTSQILFDNGTHKCISFTNLVKGEGIQANQFLIIDHERAAVLDPGGDLTYVPLTMELNRYTKLKNLDYVMASHQDPDIITSMPRWLVYTDAKVVASKLWAHFLHSVGNFQFYDPTAKILFSGDMGASIVDDASVPIIDFEAHTKKMKGFHQRYMCSNKVIRLWVNMVRQMDLEMIVPQHGTAFVGKEMIEQFLDWIETLECGVDLMNEYVFSMPTEMA
ncbi:FprA family A-type flavoprotein [Acinetobacter suaedae]|uniref:FprA family A-type flavoprotein n=1 Tax=Acinetobacter suaedae TaxID=2609668 RepID=A0A5P1UQ95_9GAMM|nr:MBL fold metallo-hydrolase [Acinetobacter sp. C16S1]QER38312.1 FprA family A-type flavoprotein [Acinetobacter sp. C16S1]